MICPLKVQQGYIETLLPPFMQFSCADISWAVGSPSLDVLLICAAAVRPSGESALWGVLVLPLCMAQASHCSSMCRAPTPCPSRSLPQLDILPPSCLVPQVRAPLTTSMPQSRPSSDGWKLRWNRVHWWKWLHTWQFPCCLVVPTLLVPQPCLPVLL